MPDANNPLTPNMRQTSQAAVRVFFVDEKSGHPVAGLVVSIFSDSPRAADPQPQPASLGNQRQLLATQQTDLAGYVSYKFDRSRVAGNSHLAVSYGGARGNALILNVADLLAGNDTYTIQINASDNVENSSHLGLPSILSPDIKDLAVSPGSIGLIPRLSQSGGLCNQLMPTTMAVRRFGAFLIKADICRPSIVNCADEIQMVRGTMLEFEITWNPVGAALGDLLNTITLAPCEKVTIAISDWTRRETASQSQATDIQQQSFQEINHDRLIVETMQSSIKNKASAWAIAGTRSVGLSVPLTEGVKLDLTSAFGGGYARSNSAMDVALNTSNQLSEHITQAASSVYSRRSTVVFQSTASEHQTYQTRTFSNNNHCHDLTQVFYQVNRNYEVVTDFKGERDVVLVKCDNADFDANRAYRNAELLKTALLDQSLVSCFDELADALFCCELTPVTVAPTLPLVKPLLDSWRLTVDVRDVQGVMGGMSIALLGINNALLFSASIGGASNTSTLWPIGIHSHLFSVNPPIDPALINSVQIFLIASNPWGLNSPPPAPPTAILNKIDITYKVAGQTNWLNIYSLQTGTTISNFWNTPVDPDLPSQQQTPTLPPATAVNECVEKSCCIQKLLGHLNYNKRYYNSILWLNEDPNERVMRWSCCVADEPFNLIAQIENDPITIYGDFLVFPAAGSQLVDDPAVLPVSKLVTMPTPGVYAEGILGQCNTCEKIDPDRFWSWKDSPCPDTGSAVSAAPAPQTGVKPSDLEADTISNLITFSTVPGAPESIIKDLVSELVSKADSGSTEAKALLNNLLQKLLEKIK